MSANSRARGIIVGAVGRQPFKAEAPVRLLARARSLRTPPVKPRRLDRRRVGQFHVAELPLGEIEQLSGSTLPPAAMIRRAGTNVGRANRAGRRRSPADAGFVAEHRAAERLVGEAPPEQMIVNQIGGRVDDLASS